MLLMVLPTGDDVAERYEFLRAPSPTLLAREDADEDDLRNDVRRLWGEKRAVMAWKREGCIVS